MGSPATSFSAIAAAATDEAVPSRIFYEYLGLALGADGIAGSGDETTGFGLVMRPTTETRIVNFSSRGPASDGRLKPEIAALGTWSFVQAPTGGFNWVTGTSFSAPTTSGAAALLNAYWEGTLGRETDPAAIRNALLLGADSRRVGREWQGVNAQGLGVLEVASALGRLKRPCGLWSFAGFPVAAQPMEPGLMKLSLAGDFVNESHVGGRVRITRENEAERLQKPVSKSVISQDDVFIVPVEVPDGTAQVTFNLKWQRDWSRFPTSDLDLILHDPDMNVILDGATFNAPERAVVTHPTPGTYYAVVAGFEVDKTDSYRLFVTME